MNKMSDAQRRKIFKLAGEKGLDQEVLHSFVQKLTGKDSLRQLSIMDAVKVINGLEGKQQTADGMITTKQKRFIEGLAKDIGMVDEEDKLDRARLNAFIESKYGTGNITWLTSKKASDVIEGLKAMKGRIAEREAM